MQDLVEKSPFSRSEKPIFMVMISVHLMKPVLNFALEPIFWAFFQSIGAVIGAQQV